MLPPTQGRGQVRFLSALPPLGCPAGLSRRDPAGDMYFTAIFCGFLLFIEQDFGLSRVVTSFDLESVLETQGKGWDWRTKSAAWGGRGDWGGVRGVWVYTLLRASFLAVHCDLASALAPCPPQIVLLGLWLLSAPGEPGSQRLQLC